jgi:hypothetical protein
MRIFKKEKNIMKRNRIISWFLLAGLLFAGCKKYLDYQPQVL